MNFRKVLGAALLAVTMPAVQAVSVTTTVQNNSSYTIEVIPATFIWDNISDTKWSTTVSPKQSSSVTTPFGLMGFYVKATPSATTPTLKAGQSLVYNYSFSAGQSTEATVQNGYYYIPIAGTGILLWELSTDDQSRTITVSQQDGSYDHRHPENTSSPAVIFSIS
jgi:hypothetical protein